MKKVLMGTTALVMASVALANVASAEVSVSGSISYFLTYKSGEDTSLDGSKTLATGKENKYGVSLDLEQLDWQSEIVVSGGGVTDAGLNYGAEAQIRAGVDLQPSGSATTLGAGGSADTVTEVAVPGDFVTTDEAFLYVGGDSWGKIIIGNDDDALNRVQVHAGSVAVGLGHQWNGTANQLNGGGTDDARITYQTPSFSGFNAAVSITPTRGSAENSIAAGANFSQDLGGMSFKVGGGIRTESQLNRGDTAVRTIAVGETLVSEFGYQTGVSGTFDAFSVSLGYFSVTESTKKGNADGTDIDKKLDYLGATVAYDFGGGGVSIAYLYAAKDKSTTKPDKKGSNSIVIDADFKLADGLTAQFEAALNSGDPDTENDPASGFTDPSETIVGLGLVASF